MRFATVNATAWICSKLKQISDGFNVRVVKFEISFVWRLVESVQGSCRLLRHFMADNFMVSIFQFSTPLAVAQFTRTNE